VWKERRASCPQHLAKAIVDGAIRPCLGRRTKKREMLGEEQRDTSVLRANCSAAHPHDRTGAEQGVEVTRVVLLDASRQDPCLEIRRRDERAFELRDRVDERGLPALAGIDAVPGHREPAERILVDRLNLAAKTR